MVFQNLWEELNSLKAILVDVRDSVSQFVAPSPRGRGLKSIRNARNFSSIYYNDNQYLKDAIIKALLPAPHSNNDYEVSIDIFTVTEFSLDILHSNDHLRDMVRKFIETENNLLESEILKMNIEIENSADIDTYNSSMQQSPRTPMAKNPTTIHTISLEDAPLLCESCSLNSKPVNNSKSLGPNKISSSKTIKEKAKTALVFGDSICSVCKITKVKLEANQKETSSSPLRWEFKDTQKNRDSQCYEYSPSTQTEGEVPSVPSRGNSKFRNKLNTARDELHFFEEF